MREVFEKSVGGFRIYAELDDAGAVTGYVARAAGIVKRFSTLAQAEDWIQREFSEEERKLIEQVAQEQNTAPLPERPKQSRGMRR